MMLKYIRFETISFYLNILKYVSTVFIICEAHPRLTYGQLTPEINLTNENLTSLMEEFAHNNPGLAVKNGSSKAVVAQFVSNCDSKSDRSVAFIIHIPFLYPTH